MRFTISSLTRYFLLLPELRAKETSAVETPTASAISFMVVFFPAIKIVQEKFGKFIKELRIEKAELQEVAYFSPFNSDSKTFQKVYLLRYTTEICEFDRDGIEKIYYKSKKEIKELMNEESNLFKTDYSVVMKYLFDKNYL